MGEYDDLLYLPHPVSRKHPPMSAMDRAAQFSPSPPSPATRPFFRRRAV